MPIIYIGGDGQIIEQPLEFTIEQMEKVRELRKLQSQWQAVNDSPERWNIIRKVYERQTPIILDRAAHGYLGMTNPYILDWCKYMTPIEYDAWCSIRSKGLGLFPQYPALNYFLDFANPYLKIGVELDGKDYHDPEKDLIRDTRLWEAGWKIFRIPGRECFTHRKMLWDIQEEASAYDQEQDQNDLRAYFCETSDGIFEAISIMYFSPQDDYSHRYISYAARSLDQHRLAQFSI